jgi:hypothetical protein
MQHCGLSGSEGMCVYERGISVAFVTCGPIARERVDKRVSVEVDSWRPTRYGTRFRVSERSTNISLDTATLYKRPFR